MRSGGGIDQKLTDLRFVSSGAHHELFRRLRRDDPVHWTGREAAQAFGSICGHEDFVAILKEPFWSSSLIGGLIPLSAEKRVGAQWDAGGYGAIPQVDR